MISKAPLDSQRCFTLLKAYMISAGGCTGRGLGIFRPGPLTAVGRPMRLDNCPQPTMLTS